MPAKLAIAVVEDNDDLRDLIIASIEQHGHSVSGADCAEALDELLLDQKFDLIILDLNLPGENGLSIAKRLKIVNPDIFIIMVTARQNEIDKVTGYDHGADIYLTKPVSQVELTAAISSLSRRIASLAADPPALCLDIRKSVLTGEKPVSLSKSESQMLKSLAEAPQWRLSYFRLIELSGREVDEKSKANLEVQIGRLRKKMAEAGVRGPGIRTIRGEAYQLVDLITIV